MVSSTLPGRPGETRVGEGMLGRRGSGVVIYDI